MSIPKIVIEIEGGVIQNIDSDLPVKVIVLDYDDDAQDDPKETEVTLLDGETTKAVVSIYTPEETTQNKQWPEHLFKQFPDSL